MSYHLNVTCSSNDRAEQHTPVVWSNDRAEQHTPVVWSNDRTEQHTPLVWSNDRAEQHTPLVWSNNNPLDHLLQFWNCCTKYKISMKIMCCIKDDAIVIVNKVNIQIH